MKRLLRLLLLAAACCLMCSCTRDPIGSMASSLPENASAIPDARPASALSASQPTVTLWFRYGTEPLLAPEAREIDLTPTHPFEQALLEALLSGPSAGSAGLNGLFPEGTQVLSTHRQGRLLFVTLSGQIMNPLADEPAAWRTQPAWADEVPLRRCLAMQSIAATVTDNLSVDQVVILVEPREPGSSLRLQAAYYQAGASRDELAPPLTRDESLLLSPMTCMEVILTAWQERSWQRLYLYTTHDTRGEYEPFVRQMESMPPLTDWSLSGGSVSPDGATAVFTVDAHLLTDGQMAAQTGLTFRLTREQGVWRIALGEMTSRGGNAP